MLAAPKPVIAAVNGPAYASGMGLAGMCDIVLATSSARFATPEVKVDIFQMIIVAHLCRAIPRKRLVEMMFTGEPMTAEEAYRLGFVNRVYPGPDEMMAGVREFAGKLAKASPDAIRLGRRTFTLLSEMSAGQGLDAAQFMLMPFHLGEDIQEGANASSSVASRRGHGWTPTERKAHDRHPGRHRMNEAFVVAAVRTPVCRRNGVLRDVHPADLAAQVIADAVRRAGVDPTAVDDVLLGCVSQVGAQAFNLARTAALSAGLAESVPAAPSTGSAGRLSRRFTSRHRPSARVTRTWWSWAAWRS
jgi:hypothetical protein